MTNAAIQSIIANAPEAPPETAQQTIARLSALASLDYEQVREAEAKRLGIRVSALDAEVNGSRDDADTKTLMMFPMVKPWHEPVEGAALLHEIEGTIRRFIICEPETATAAALWIAFSWSVDVVDVAPLAVITAPEKRCGKSQLLNLIARLCRRPLVASNISPSATFRVIEAHTPTMLIDEADAFMRDNEELRGILNSGHTRQSAYVIRNVGDDHEPKQFSTWGAKALSGIGALPDTIMDRAIVLELRRKLPSENVERLRHAEKGLFARLASMLARWSQDNSAAIERARPTLPEALNDRAQDNWEPLLAIADCAGGDWPQLARDTALKISGGGQEGLSLSAELLADIHAVFQRWRGDRIATVDLLAELVKDEEAPWATYNRGKPMAPRQLAKRLGEYAIKPATARIGGMLSKGYAVKDFDDVFARYLVPSPSSPVFIRNSVTNAEKPVVSNGYPVTDNSACYGNKSPSVTHNTLINNDCYAVTDRNGETGGNKVEVTL